MVKPYLGIAKQHLADQLSSPATSDEGSQNMLWFYLAGALLLGLLGNALMGGPVARPGREMEVLTAS